MKILGKVALVLLLLAADKQKPIAKGPQYDLGKVPESKKQAKVTVTIGDIRPTWERLYCAGSTDPRRYENGVTFIPMESFHASPLSHLKWEVAAQLCALGDPPAKIRLRLNSFRVIISEVVDLKAAYDTRKSERRRVEHDDDEDVKTYIAKEAGAPLLELLAEGFDWLAGKYSDHFDNCVIYAERYLQGPPKEMKERYAPDITCDIRATAIVVWADGRKRQIELRSLVNSGTLVLDKPHMYRSSDIVGVVNGAVNGIGKELERKIVKKQPMHNVEPPPN